MSFDKDEVIAQPPKTHSRIFETVPAGQFAEMQRRIYELENSMRAIRNYIIEERKEWIKASKPLDQEPVVESLPILVEVNKRVPE